VDAEEVAEEDAAAVAPRVAAALNAAVVARNVAAALRSAADNQEGQEALAAA
jgi:hypothetical protein